MIQRANLSLDSKADLAQPGYYEAVNAAAKVFQGQFLLVQDREVYEASAEWLICAGKFPKKCDGLDLLLADMELTSALRNSLARSWGVREWSPPKTAEDKRK